MMSDLTERMRKAAPNVYLVNDDELSDMLKAAAKRIDDLEYAANEVIDVWIPAKPLEYYFSAQEWDAYQHLVAVMKDGK